MTNYRNQISWKIFQGEASEAYKPTFDDSSWRVISLPMFFDARKGGAWIRCRITVPEEIEGIKISGSTVKFYSSAILDKSELFVDGRMILKSDYWMELRGPKIILDENAKPGQTFIIAVHVFPKYEAIEIPQFFVSYSNIERVSFEIESFIEEIRFAKFLDRELTEKVLREFDLKAFDGNALNLIKEIEKARERLSVLSQKAKEFKVYLVAHAHIDMNWLWPWEDTLRTIKETFSTMIKLMNKYDDFHFSQSQAVTYKVVEENFPSLFDAIKQNVKKGNWDITASMWVEADLNMAGTEALLRQFLYARDYINQKFGVKPKVCWEPDTFGHIWTLPQILRKYGIKYYYFMRCGKGHPIFWWEGPDGSRVLAFTSVYNNTVTPKNIVDLVLELYERYGLKSSMFVYGAGDHGGGATVEDIEATYEMQKKPALPELLFSSTSEFFEQAEREIEEKGLIIPVVNDELQFTFDGCYTTHGDIKRYNRLCESLLIDAEKICVITSLHKNNYLKDSWLKMLFNQFHDILDGSGSAEAYNYPRKLAQETIEAVTNFINSTIKTFSERLRFSGDGIPIIVFNTLSWDRIDLVRVKIPMSLLPKNAVAVSYDGKDMCPIQVCGDEVIFLARVPSMGYRVYYIVGGNYEKISELRAYRNLLENEHFRIEVNEFSGTLRSLYDKSGKRFVFKEVRYPDTKPVFSNLMQILYEVPHPMSAWVIGPVSSIKNLIKDANLELIEDGPVRATLKISWRYHNSKITQYISLYGGMSRIEFRLLIDWQEVADDKTESPMLKVSYTPILNKAKATFEIPFGYIERIPDGTEYPALRWVDLSDNEYGLGLINNCKYGFDVNGNTVRMTLIRTSYSPDPRPDQGEHEILYALYPHKGDWKSSLTFRVGCELNHPLIAHAVLNSKGTDGYLLEEEKSLLKVKPDNIVVSCCKKSEDSDDLIIRIYDATGEGANAELYFNFIVKEAYETDLMETPIKPLKSQGKIIQIRVNPFEIKTLRIKQATHCSLLT
ncbi:MAG: glycoside hydrolase family 38 C-terminal domain-containing protein [Candidatus Bathyarchaeia archaeon]